MRAGQRETRATVIEGRRAPASGIVALLAAVGELICRMAGTISAVVIRLVTRPASRRCAVELTVNVASITGGADVRAGQREIGQVVIKGCRLPRRSRVTCVARMRELAGHVIRILYVFIITLVAGVALRRRVIILSVGMALSACHRDMGAGERELRQVVVKRRRSPCDGRMALRACMTVVPRDVVRIGYRLIVRLMAAVAVRRQVLILSARVTRGAVDAHMRAG